MEKLFIIDAVNYLFRSYYAIGPMTNDKGESTSAIYGFIRSVQKLIKEFSPKYIVAVFDGPDNKLSRQTFYADYKMHRKGAPEDLFPQFAWAHDFCEMAGISVLCVEGVEADDTMASVAKWGQQNDLEVYICTSDKDMAQVVNDHIFILNAHKNNLLLDAKKVKEIYGVRPDQMLDYLSITGDASDNIPGISGFGPKTAVSLLEEFGTLDNILANPEKVKGKKKQETIVEQKQQALLSKKLATLDFNIPFPKEKDFFLQKEIKTKELATFYEEMKFITLLKDLHPRADQKESSAKIQQESSVDYILINDENALDHLIGELLKEKEIAIDTETKDLNFIHPSLVGIGFCAHPTKAWYVPLNGNIDSQKVLQKIKPLIENPNNSFYGHNLKYDYHVLKHYGIEIKNICFDTLLASYLLSPQNRRHNLDQLVLEKFHKTKIPIKQLIEKDKKQITMDLVPLASIANYCCEDVDYTARLKELFEKEIKEKKLETVLYEIELPLLPILAKMENHGIFINQKLFAMLNEEFSLELKKIEQEIFQDVGKEFNINSPKQLGQILYVDLELPLPTRKKTQSTFSTAAPILEKLAKTSPVVTNVLQYRALQKLLSTYVIALPKQIDPKTKRVHSTFNQSITATGRLSSQNPNLQNIPIRSKEGIRIREGFEPQENHWSYLAADYSQIELRILAHFSEDEELIKAFLNGEDIHAHTASLVLGVPLEEITKEQRYIAKAVNFGIIYGQGSYGLAQQLNIPMKEASSFIKTYFARYNKIEPFLTKCKETAEKTGFVQTITGRQRPIGEIHNKNPSIRAAAQRLAVNTPLQGTAADIIKLAMISIDKEIKKRKMNGYLILQIHDELIFEIPDSEIADFKQLVKEKMENILSLKVPLIVDIEIGKNWGQC